MKEGQLDLGFLPSLVPQACCAELPRHISSRAGLAKPGGPVGATKYFCQHPRVTPDAIVWGATTASNHRFDGLEPLPFNWGFIFSPFGFFSTQRNDKEKDRVHMIPLWSLQVSPPVHD